MIDLGITLKSSTYSDSVRLEFSLIYTNSSMVNTRYGQWSTNFDRGSFNHLAFFQKTQNQEPFTQIQNLCSLCSALLDIPCIFQSHPVKKKNLSDHSLLSKLNNEHVHCLMGSRRSLMFSYSPLFSGENDCLIHELLNKFSTCFILCFLAKISPSLQIKPICFE